MCHLILVLLVFNFSGIFIVHNSMVSGKQSCQDNSRDCAVDVSACADKNGNLKLELECGRSMVVVADKVRSARLSRNITDKCVHKKTGLFYQPNSSYNMMKCLWRKKRCRFTDNVMKDVYHSPLPHTANYMIAENFQCLEEERITDICSKRNSIENIQTDYGYIISPSYPNKYHKGNICRKVISNGGFYANISLSFKTLHIQNSVPCNDFSQEYIQLRSLQPGGRWLEEYYCAGANTELPMDITLMGYVVEIVFKRGGRAANTGFRIDFVVHNASEFEPTEISTQGITSVSVLSESPQFDRISQIQPVSSKEKGRTFMLKNIHIIFISVISLFFLCIVICTLVISIQHLKKRRLKNLKKAALPFSKQKDVTDHSAPDIVNSLLNQKEDNDSVTLDKDNLSSYTFARGYL